jgi:hypothetical protein
VGIDVTPRIGGVPDEQYLTASAGSFAAAVAGLKDSPGNGIVIFPRLGAASGEQHVSSEPGHHPGPYAPIALGPVVTSQPPQLVSAGAPRSGVVTA